MVAASVILYSGGMDSFVLGHMQPDAVKLYVNTCSQYAEKEIAHLPPGVTVHPDVMNLRSLERPDAIVPSRNAYLALVAANYGDVIALGATAGDMSTDKDEQWALQMTDLLRYMYSSHHFQEREPLYVRVTLPIKHLTKLDLVQWYLARGGDAQALANVVSCYHPTHLHCGHCKACTRKWAALKAAGVEFDGWAEDPAQAPAWKEVVEKFSAGRRWRTAREDEYTWHVLRLAGRL